MESMGIRSWKLMHGENPLLCLGISQSETPTGLLQQILQEFLLGTVSTQMMTFDLATCPLLFCWEPHWWEILHSIWDSELETTVDYLHRASPVFSLGSWKHPIWWYYLFAICILFFSFCSTNFKVEIQLSQIIFLIDYEIIYNTKSEPQEVPPVKF